MLYKSQTGVRLWRSGHGNNDFFLDSFREIECQGLSQTTTGKSEWEAGPGTELSTEVNLRAGVWSSGFQQRPGIKAPKGKRSALIPCGPNGSDPEAVCGDHD